VLKTTPSHLRGRLIASAVAVLAAAGAAVGADGIHIASGKTTSFTWALSDAQGYRWDITGDGRVNYGTNNAYDAGMRLRISGSYFSSFSTGRLSKDGKEVEVGPWKTSNLSISRRVFINTQAGYCRWIDIFENPTGQEVSVSLSYYSNMGESTYQTHTTKGAAAVTGKDWGVVTCGSSSSSSRPAVVHVFASAGSKVKPAFQFTRGSDALYYRITLKVPPKRAVALCLFEAQRRPYSAAQKFLKDFKPDREMALVPAALRDIVVNMTGGSLTLGGIDLQRSTKADIMILSTGDEMLGTVANASYAVTTAFGDVTIPAGDALGLVSVPNKAGSVRMILKDGQVVAGQLTNGPVVIKLSGGTELKIPAKGIRQMGYRITPARPAAVASRDALICLRRGERLAFDQGVTFPFLTVHGTLSLRPADLTTIRFDTVEGGLHQVVFRNGSTVAGLLVSQRLALKLKLGLPLDVPRQEVERLYFATVPAKTTGLARLALRNGDVLHGRFADKQWVIQGKFGQVARPPADVSKGSFSAEAFGQAALVLRDGTKLSGKFSGNYLSFQIAPGPTVKVFIGHIDTLTGGAPPASTQPATKPSTAPAAPGVREEPAYRSRNDVTRTKLQAELAALQAQQRQLQAIAAQVRAELAKASAAGQKGKVAELARMAAETQARLTKVTAQIDEVKKVLAQEADRAAVRSTR